MSLIFLRCRLKKRPRASTYRRLRLRRRLSAAAMTAAVTAMTAAATPTTTTAAGPSASTAPPAAAAPRRPASVIALVCVAMTAWLVRGDLHQRVAVERGDRNLAADEFLDVGQRD